MIGKPVQKRKNGKSSFKQLIDYISSGKSAKGEEKVEYVNSQNIIGIETAATEMVALASDNKRCKDPVFHFVLSFRELEIPTKGQVDEAVHIALEELNLENCQAVWGLHYNTENKHIHVAVNRIDPETLKAIQPGNNFTVFALQRASRKIEFTQGWEIEQTGNYTVTEDGQIIEKGKNENHPPPLSPGARDGEAHTAEKSAERIGQEIAAHIVRAAKTWQELHENLAAQGISFEKKGSGAVLKIGDTVIKASVVGRDISLSKLEATLGSYVPRDSNIQVSPRPPSVEPTEKVKPEVRGTWEEYQKFRTEYSNAKNKGFSELKKSQKEESAKLSKRQKDERSKIFADSKDWKGRGRELNQLRSVLAARQKTEKLDLRDKQRGELKNFKGIFPRAILSFKDWLQKDNSLSVSFRYQKNQPVMLADSEEEKTISSPPPDLRAFDATVGNKGGVAYSRGGNVDFLDYGKRILLSEKYDSTSILAALQLASQKWGSVSLKGTDEYKRLCVDTARRHNIKITNPELQETDKQLKEFETKAQEQRAIYTTWNVGASDPSGAYWAHYKDIAGKQNGAMDYSRVDAMIGVRMRVTGYNPSQVQSAIENNAPEMRKENMTTAEFNEKYRNRDWHRFAQETTEKFVFGARGTIQHGIAEDYRSLYMKLEGRNAAQEIRQFHAIEREREIEQEREEEDER